MSGSFTDKHPCALVRADRGQWLTETERHILSHNMRWGSDGYPVRKLGRKWHVDSPLAPFGVFATKREAIAFWENLIDILIDLSGLESYNRHMTEATR